MPLNVQCKRCANLHNDWCDKKHDSPDLDMVRDCQYYRTLTNYDRIISKTPEELAKFLMRTGACFHDDCDYCNGKDCDECWLDWLKQEATK